MARSLALCCLLSLFASNLAWAVVLTDIRRIALLGDVASVSNSDMVHFDSFQAPMINNIGDVAFTASIENSAGNLVDDRGIRATQSGVLTERLRESELAPGAAPDGSTLFSFFRNLTFNDAGVVGFLGDTNQTDYRSGYWTNSSSATLPIAVLNTPLIGYPWEYASVDYVPSLNSQGKMAFNLSIAPPVTLVGFRYGIFINDSFSVDQVALQGESAVGTSGLFGRIIRTDPPINDSGETAFQIELVDPNTGQKISEGIFAGNSQNLTLVAQSGQSAPGTNGTFLFLANHRMPLNNDGDTVFKARLQGGTIIPENDRGIWRTNNGAIELLARRGNIALPAMGTSADAVFDDFFSSTVDDTDQVVFSAYLTGVDITPSKRTTLWSARPGELKLLLQPGMSAPGTSDTFSSFSTNGFATNRNGQVVVHATAGGLNGIWAQDPAGLFLLIARVGDMLEVAPGEFRSITGIDLFSLSGGGDGRSRVINDAGEIVFTATLDDGRKGIFVSDVAAYLAADFDRDGDVDLDDLTDPEHGWQARYGIDLDGHDFLTWQRQLGSSISSLRAVTSSPTVVPEPATIMILLIAASCTATRCTLRSLRRNCHSRHDLLLCQKFID